MSRAWSALGVAATFALAFAFGTMNSGQRVTLRLGFATIYGVPLTVVAFGGLMTGMLVMLVAGIHSDLRVRRILRARLTEEADEERVAMADRHQRELFDPDGSKD